MDSATKDQDRDQDTTITEVTLLMKVQTAGKNWSKAPVELVQLRDLLLNTGYEVSWNPQKLGINLLTPNKIRGIVLKRMLMKLYPFESFWNTETLDETLHKCLLVCQQLGIEADRQAIWGQCSMEVSYSFWIRVLNMIPRSEKGNAEEDIQLAKSNVIGSLISTRGTDWDKRISKNFEEGLGKKRVATLVQNTVENNFQEDLQKSRLKSCFRVNNADWRASFRNVFETKPNADPSLTTLSFANMLKQECQDMVDMLKNLETYYTDDCVLQIEKAFQLGKKVCELADEFDGYMSANNRGAFRDVDTLTNHTDKVVKAMSKLTVAYQDFFLEFQKYFRNGRGDELSLPPFPYSTEFMDRNVNN